MHHYRSFVFSCLAMIALAVLGAQAFAGSTAVGSCAAAGTHYSTIQAAVTAAEALTGPNTVRVCPGNYPEQVVINNPSAALFTLTGVQSTAPPPTQDAAVILPPVTGAVQNTTDTFDSHPIAAQLLVLNPSGPVSILNLTVDGFGNQVAGCLDFMGILYQNASGTVNHVAARNQVPGDILNGCQSGQGIWVETSSVANVIVENSSVHNYNKNGIVGRRAGTHLTVTGNYVQGSGIVPGSAAQNGIELAFGATGTVQKNTVIDNLYNDPTSFTASDILLFDAAESSGITVSNNILGNSQTPIGIFTTVPGVTGDSVSVTLNKIFGTGAFDAIDVCTNLNTVKSNTIFNSAESGVHFDSSCGGSVNNTATGNTILESACAGILNDGGVNTTSPNTFFTVPFPVTNSIGSCTIPEFGGAAPTKARGKVRP